MRRKTKQVLFLIGILTFLSGCSSFTGIRTPRYDGRPFEVQPEKISAYSESREIVGEEKEHYLPEAFSLDILNASLDYIDHEPILLEEGTYVIGEEIPSGRVNIIGEKENPNVVIGGFEDQFAPTNPQDYRVGTMTIRDEEGKLYFENMFHPLYGVLITQVDFIEGHIIEIIGSNPEIVVFYDEELPNDPYVFDTRWEDYLAEMEQQEGYVEFVGPEEELVETEFEGEIYLHEQVQALRINAEDQTVELKAGIYEVGKHLEPGIYEITEESAAAYTELFIFNENAEPRVIEMNKHLFGLMHGWAEMNAINPEAEKPKIELLPGDKIYPHYVLHLKLTKIE